LAEQKSPPNHLHRFFFNLAWNHKGHPTKSSPHAPSSPSPSTSSKAPTLSLTVTDRDKPAHRLLPFLRLCFEADLSESQNQSPSEALLIIPSRQPYHLQKAKTRIPLPLSFGFSPLRFPHLSTPTDHHTKIKSNSSPSSSWAIATPAATKSARKPRGFTHAAREPTRRQLRWRVATVPPLSRVAQCYSYASDRLQT